MSPETHLTERNREWWTLSGACAGLFLLMLDSTIVALALPAIERDLDASTIGLQWVMNAYLLTITVLVATIGRLGDMFGRRRLFLCGLGVFAAGSILSAIAGQGALIAGRIVLGAGAAALLPLSIALVAAAFPRARQPRAFGIWAAVSAIRAWNRAARRWTPDRPHVAADLLDQPADRGARRRHHPRLRARDAR